jgi:hypothetical protein
MAILYRLTVNNPNSTTSIYPPNVIESDWYKAQADFLKAPAIKIFRTLEELTTWANERKLNNAELQASLAGWKSAHGITIQEHYYEIPEITPDVPSIFG